jgi:hypothetical protein
MSQNQDLKSELEKEKVETVKLEAKATMLKAMNEASIIE